MKAGRIRECDCANDSSGQAGSRLGWKEVELGGRLKSDPAKFAKAARLRACLKTCPVRGLGLQQRAVSVVSCRPRALTRRFGGVFKQPLRRETTLPIKWIAARLHRGTGKSTKSKLHHWMQVHDKTAITQAKAIVLTPATWYVLYEQTDIATAMPDH